MESIMDENKKGRMIALFVPDNIGRELHSMFKDVPGEAVEPQDMHITLGLLYPESGDDKKIELVAKDLAKMSQNFGVSIDGFGKFPPGDHGKHVLWAKPNSEFIHYLHDSLFDLFKKHKIRIDNGDFPFKPHITVKYCDEDPEPVLDRKLKDPVFRVKNLSFASGGNVSHYPIEGSAASIPQEWRVKIK
jgi:2'-5' RNA ligase